MQIYKSPSAPAARWARSRAVNQQSDLIPPHAWLTGLSIGIRLKTVPAKPGENTTVALVMFPANQ
jgi:hypothetical protein